MNRESWLSSLQPGDTAVEVASGTTMPVTVIECKKSRIWYVPGTRAIWHDSPADAPQARCVRADTGVAGDASRHLIPNDPDEDGYTNPMCMPLTVI